MSTWTAPATWANSAVTAAQMNTEIRDHALWLKGAIDLITNSTAADVGDSTLLMVKRASAATTALAARVTADTNDRWHALAGGDLEWGPGNAAADVLMGRVSTAVLRLNTAQLRIERTANGEVYLAGRKGSDSQNRVELSTDASGNGQIAWGSGAAAVDVAIYRRAAGIISTGEADVLEHPAAGATGIVEGYKVTGDGNNRHELQADGKHLWGTGGAAADTDLFRNGVGVLKTNNRFTADNGITTKLKAGAFSTASEGTDFGATAPANGTIGVNTSGATPRLAVRHNGTWFGINLTAGG